jgi:hypothetical protein
MFGYKRCISCEKIKRIYKEKKCWDCYSKLGWKRYSEFSSNDEQDVVIPALVLASALSDNETAVPTEFTTESATGLQSSFFEGGDSGGGGAERSFDSPEPSSDNSSSCDSDSSDSSDCSGGSD